MTNSLNEDFVAEFRAEIAQVKARLTGLENLANRLGYTVDVPPVDSVPEATPDPEVGTPVATVAVLRPDTVQGVSDVDYGGVAYGLVSMRDKLVRAFGSSTELNREYEGVVEWFVACFAGDASFNATAFRSNAGI